MKSPLFLSNLLPLLLLPNIYSYTAQDLFDAGCDAANVSIILKANPELVNAGNPERKNHPILYSLWDWAGLCGNDENSAIEMLKILLATPSVNVNYQDRAFDNYTTLMGAVLFRSYDFVKLLLDFPDTDVNAVSSTRHAVGYGVYYGDSALLLSFERGYRDIEVARLLIQSPKVDVNLDHGTGHTALMEAQVFACTDYRLLITELLLNRSDIDVNAKSRRGPALFYAYFNSDYWSQIALLKCYYKILQHPKLDKDARDNDGANLLMKLGDVYYDNYFIGGNLHAEFILNTTSSNINARDNAGKTVIMRMAGSDEQLSGAMFTYLIKRTDADLSIRDNEGNTAFMLAIASRSQMSFVQRKKESPGYEVTAVKRTWELLGSSQIGNINAKNNAGDTSLILSASMVPHYENMEKQRVEFLLLVPGIDVNVQNNDGNNALMVACFNGRVEIVKLLLADPRVDLHAKNNKGQTARDMVPDWRPEIAKLLPLNRDTVIGASVGGSFAAVLAIAFILRRRFRKSIAANADALNSSGMDMKPIRQNNASV